jgi:hypothetical protein
MACWISNLVWLVNKYYSLPKKPGNVILNCTLQRRYNNTYIDKGAVAGIVLFFKLVSGNIKIKVY